MIVFYATSRFPFVFARKRVELLRMLDNQNWVRNNKAPFKTAAKPDQWALENSEMPWA